MFPGSFDAAPTPSQASITSDTPTLSRRQSFFGQQNGSGPFLLLPRFKCGHAARFSKVSLHRILHCIPAPCAARRTARIPIREGSVPCSVYCATYNAKHASLGMIRLLHHAGWEEAMAGKVFDWSCGARKRRILSPRHQGEVTKLRRVCDTNIVSHLPAFEHLHPNYLFIACTT